jgi:TonB-linked SusC/RagA family outer membrane protein
MKRFVFVLSLLLFVGMNLLQAQGVQVSGNVTSADDGTALPGVSVVVRGTTIGAVTDFEGNYSITVPDENATLMFSFVGMLTQDVPLEGRTVLNVVLESTTTELDEVVVTALGVSREKKALGYSVQEVDGEEMTKALQTDAVSALAGRVAGVQISSSTNMGGSTNIMIRGASSITQNNQPLFIVDGIPMDNSNYSGGGAASGGGGIDYGNLLNDLNPDEIAEISVLKGPAAALYGSRAANGVVLITTKKARKGLNDVSVELNSNIGFDRVSTIPILQTKYGGGGIVTGSGTQDGFQVVNEGGTDYLVPQYAIDESWGPRYNSSINVLHWDGFNEDGTYTTRPWVAPENDVETYWETGTTVANSLAISKSGPAYGVRVAYKNTYIDGTMPNSVQKKNDFKIASDFNILPNLTVNGSLNYVRTDTKGRPTLGYAGESVGQKFFQWGQRQLDYERLKEYKTSTGEQRTWNRISFDNPVPKYSDNPYWTAYENTPEDVRNRLLGTLSVGWEIIDDLVLKGSIYGDMYSYIQETRRAVGSQSTSDYSETNRNFMETNLEAILSYRKQFERVGFSVMGGANRRFETYSRLNASANGGLVVPGVYNLLNSTDAVTIGDFTREKQVNSVFAQASVDIAGLLFLDGSYRVDWSSTLPEDNNQYGYPSVSASFLFSNLLEVSWLNLGKVRLGWAEVGNDTNPYNVYATYSYNGNGAFGGTPRLFKPDGLLNENLKPETTQSLEAGLDLVFFQNRLDLSATYFSNTTFDQIMPLDVSQATGYRSVYINAGEMTNKGVEISLGLVPVRMGDFEWSLRLNFAKVNNELVELFGDIVSLDIQRAPFGGVYQRASVGDTYGMLWGNDYIYDDDGNKVVGDNGYWLRTPNLVPIGSVLPDFTLGIRNSFTYKGFDLSVLLDIRQGGYFYSLSHMWGMYSGMLEETAAVNDQGNEIRDPVSEGGGIKLDGVTGDVTHNDDGTYTVTNTAPNEKYVEGINWAHRNYHGYGMPTQSVFEANYIKIREANLGYTFPTNLFNGVVKSLRLSVYGRNLLTFNLDQDGFDPEMTANGSGNVMGMEGGLQPMFRTMGVNLRVNF